MNNTYNIFTVKEVTFEQGKNDPFGFGDFTEKLSAKYLPFSGTIAKPSYILFTSYINRLLKEKLIPYNSAREKNEIRIRLEKLLVYCWKSRANENFRGARIIGNSLKVNEIDPFTSKGWIKQNCFRIYTENNFKAEKTLEIYLNMIGNKQIDLLNEFLGKSYIREKDKQNYLKELKKKLYKNKNSLFSYHLLSDTLKKKFKKELKEVISRNKPDYFIHLSNFYDNNKFNSAQFWKKTLENKKLPFKDLNYWFGKIVDAVDAEINEKSSLSLWKKADIAYEQIDIKHRKLDKRPIRETESWFTKQNGKYCKADNFNRFSHQWESYKRRKGEEGTGYFSTFRHYAFSRLLTELIAG